MKREKLLLSSVFLLACMLIPGLARAQTGQITGVVADSLSGQALPGVNVVIVGTQQGAASSAAGTFSIEGVEPGVYDLQATFVGYTTKVVEGIEVNAEEATEVEIRLAESAVELEEVVAVAYGTQERQAVTGSLGSLDTDEIKTMPLNSPDEALQGQIAGVTVQNSSGVPGGGPSIKVRGTGNVGAGGQPLYVIDGFALPQSNESQASRRNPLADIPTEDIESITVLKDASATAIYGSRASNGVVIVTTKSGRGDQFNFNVSASSGLNRVMRSDIVDAANAREFATFQNHIWKDRVESGAASEIPEEYRNPEQYGEGTDWWDAIMRTGRRQNINISASGGSKQMKSYFSVGVTRNEGVMRSHNFNRVSLRANVDANLSDKVTAGLKVAPTFMNRNLNWRGHDRYGAGGAPWMLCPLPPVQNEDGSFYSQPGRECTGVWSHPNPVMWLQQEDDTEQSLNTLSSVYTNYEFAPGLSARTQFNVAYKTNERTRFRPSTLGGINSPPPSTPSGWLSTGGYLNWLSETTLKWQTELGPGNIDALAGFTAQQQRNRGAFFSGQFPGDEIRTLNVASQINGTSDEQEWSLLSGLSRVNYNLLNRYIFTGTVRTDGSSRFGALNRWGTFPSGAVAWNAYNESFMDGVDDVQQLRLRASYGVTGNNQIGNYAPLGVVGNTDYVLGGSAAAGRVLNTMGNAALSWEKTRELNFGVDAVLYNRLDVSVDLYQRNTTQLLINRELPMTAGFGSVTENTGELRNRGVEVSMSSLNVERENFRWNTDVTFALNRNQIVSLPGGNDVRYSAWPAQYIHQEGLPMASYVGYMFDGLYESEEQIQNTASFPGAIPGTMIWRDLNGDGVLTEDLMKPDGDFAVLGDAYPDFTFSLGNTISVGNFDIRALFTGAFGGDNLRTEWITTSRNIDGLFNPDAAYVKNFWRSPEQPGDGLTPTPLGGAASRQQYRDTQHTLFLWESSHLWLRNLSLRYTFGSGFMEGVGIYTSASNLFILSPYPGNPDATSLYNTANNPGMDDGNYPLPRTFTFGVDLSF